MTESSQLFKPLIWVQPHKTTGPEPDQYRSYSPKENKAYSVSTKGAAAVRNQTEELQYFLIPTAKRTSSKVSLTKYIS